MKNLLCLLSLILLIAQPLVAQSWQLVSKDFTINGTSNVHDWTSNVTTVNWSGHFVFAEDGTLQINNGKITIPVSGIKSTKGRIMDGKTYDALKKDSHPNILFTASSVTATANGTNSYTANVKGTLSIAGVRKQVTVKVTIKEIGEGKVNLSGSYALKMTDFGIDPPTALMGTMTTGDDVTLKFSLDLSQSSKS
ncbi:MAG: YceI family protein [Saprospiraceae bacterium]